MLGQFVDKVCAQRDHLTVLQVHGDHVIAVVEQHFIHLAAKVFLDIISIPAAGDVVFDGVQHQRRRGDRRHFSFHDRNQSMQLANVDSRHGQQPGAAAFACFHLAFDDSPQTLVFDAVRRCFVETAQVHAERNGHQQRCQHRSFRHVPAVVAQGRRIQQQAGDLPRMLGSHVHGHHCAHRQPADEHLCVALADADKGLARALVPVFPTRGLQVGVVAAVPGKRGYVHGVPPLGQALGNPT